MYSGVLLVKEKSYHQGGTHTSMEEADRQLNLLRAGWDHSWVERRELGLLSDWRELGLH